MSKLTPEYLRQREQELGPVLVQEAIAYVRSMGWGRGSEPPMFVWDHAYHFVEQRSSERRAAITPSSHEGE